LLGTLAALVQDGYQVHVVYAARGDRGTDRSGRGLTPEALATEREQEARAALTRISPALRPEFWSFGDQTLRDQVPESRMEAITAFLR
jgi:LmbE family N-acetylglucosaminyl deacetylase